MYTYNKAASYTTKTYEDYNKIPDFLLHLPGFL